MKLVNILARELTVWPDNSSCDYCCQSDSTTEVFFGHPAGSVFLSERADETENVTVTRAQWQAAVDALKADEYHEPDNGVEAWLHGVERDYGNDAAQQCRVIIREARLKRDRSKACDNMFGVILSLPEDSQNNRSDICEALYDAGYRKFEIVDN